MGKAPGSPKTGGRQAGTPNKLSALLKDEILEAARKAHKGGRVAYLREQAVENPTAFLTLLGKVLPIQMTHAGDQDAPLVHEVRHVIVDPKRLDDERTADDT